MNTLLIALALSGVQTADTTPEPNWTEVRRLAVERITQDAFDPQSAQITWLNGWRRGEGRSGLAGVLSRKYRGWVGCARMNLRNRMGGYTGPRNYPLIYTDAGELRILNGDDPCYVGNGDRVELQAAFRDGSGAAPAVDLADELTKLAGLRDRGVLTDAEFQVQKARLLAR